MDNSIQTKFNLNKSAYIMKPAVQAEPQNPTPEKQTPEKHSNNNKLLGALGGLAVLGGAVFLIKTRKNSKPVEDTANSLAEQISELKTRIKDDYLATLTEQLGNIGTIKELRAEAAEIVSKNEKLKERLANHRNKQMGVLRQKLTDLQNDEQWIELRKLRKSLTKTLHGKSSRDEKIIAQNKIEVINDLLLTKTYPQEEIKTFRDLHGIEPDAAFKLVTTNFTTAEEYKKAYKAAQTVISDDIPIGDRWFTHTRELKLANLFPDEIRSYICCNKEIRRLNAELDEVKLALNQRELVLKDVALKFRASKDVQDLKQLVSGN